VPKATLEQLQHSVQWLLNANTENQQKIAEYERTITENERKIKENERKVEEQATKGQFCSLSRMSQSLQALRTHFESPLRFRYRC
jgi:hypothetical protein